MNLSSNPCHAPKRFSALIIGGTPSIALLWIEVHNQMKEIAHDGKGIYGDREVLSQMQHALLERIFTMFIVFSGESINTTQPASAHTPRDDVIVHWIVRIN
jgi:hypothetical protein